MIQDMTFGGGETLEEYVEVKLATGSNRIGVESREWE